MAIITVAVTAITLIVVNIININYQQSQVLLENKELNQFFFKTDYYPDFMYYENTVL